MICALFIDKSFLLQKVFKVTFTKAIFYLLRPFSKKNFVKIIIFYINVNDKENIYIYIYIYI